MRNLLLARGRLSRTFRVWEYYCLLNYSTKKYLKALEDCTILDVRKNSVLMSLFSLPTHISRPDKRVLKFELLKESGFWAQNLSSKAYLQNLIITFLIIFPPFSLCSFFFLSLIKHFISFYLHSKWMVEMLIYLMLTVRRSGRILELYSQKRIWGSINCPFLFIVDNF